MADRPAITGEKHHEVIGQQSLMGASVVNFNVSLGYGKSPSRMSANLVVDSEHKFLPEGLARKYNAGREG